jgi:hypothetical protein
MTVDDGVAPLYEFVYRGLLTEEALDAAGRTSRYTAPNGAQRDHPRAKPRAV